MEHRTANQHQWNRSPAEHFTGEVWNAPLSQVDGALNALGVQFTPGARTDWHHHPDGQVLYVISGSGLVQTDDGETVEISAGDVVYAPPGELHWHGALPTSPMMHLSLTTGDATVWEPRRVTDEEYNRR
jgi:quercetin dioxygenase-like cupin family protein